MHIDRGVCFFQVKMLHHYSPCHLAKGLMKDIKYENETSLHLITFVP